MVPEVPAALAAEALGCEVGAIANSLLFDAGGSPVLILTSGGHRVDVEVVEEFPLTYAVAASRTHRWTRGDWQLLPMIVTPGNGLSGLARYKMIDNLRRSLVTPSWVAASIAGWLIRGWLDGG